MSFRPEYLTRQLDLIPVEKQGLSIAVVGCGAIGSFTTLALAKMGFLNLKVWDMDEVSTENMNCQFYKPTDIGKNKAEALYDMIKEFTGVEIERHPVEVKPHDFIKADIVISAVDSMEVRKNLLEITESKYIIDPRMAAEYATMEVVDRSKADRLENYGKTLYSDKEAVAERCTAKSTIYTVMLIAGQIAKVVKDISLTDKYIRTFDWDISHNRISAFDCEGKPLQ